MVPSTQTPHNGSATKGEALPSEVCAYYARGVKGIGQGCLRVNCRYYHGTEEQLANLRAQAENGEACYHSPSVTDNDLGAKRPIVCLAYLSSACNRPGCRFLHLPPHVRPLPFAICECFSRGTCTRKRCRFFHGTQEVLSRMHARGVTMYNPITNEPHDPAASLEELMRLQEQTTVPLAPPPAPPQFIYVLVNQYQGGMEGIHGQPIGIGMASQPLLQGVVSLPPAGVQIPTALGGHMGLASPQAPIQGQVGYTVGGPPLYEASQWSYGGHMPTTDNFVLCTNR